MAQIGVPVFWAGLVIGLSFIETPLKFQAPGITRELGLGIGRLVFSTLGRIEHVLALTLVALWFRTARLPVRATLTAVVLTVGVESVWLLPVLDAQAASIILGAVQPATYHHRLFVVLEVVKVLALFGLAFQHRLFTEDEARAARLPSIPFAPRLLPRGRTTTVRTQR